MRDVEVEQLLRPRRIVWQQLPVKSDRFRRRRYVTRGKSIENVRPLDTTTAIAVNLQGFKIPLRTGLTGTGDASPGAAFDGPGCGVEDLLPLDLGSTAGEAVLLGAL